MGVSNLKYVQKELTHYQALSDKQSKFRTMYSAFSLEVALEVIGAFV